MESEQKACVFLEIDQPELELGEMTSNFTLPPHQPSTTNPAGAFWNKKKKSDENPNGSPPNQNPDHLEIENIESGATTTEKKKPNIVQNFANKTEKLFQKGQEAYKKGQEMLKKNEKLIQSSKQAYDIYKGMVK